MADKLIKLPEVKNRCALGRSSIYEFIQAGTFPAPVKIGARAVAWRESEIEEWISTRQSA